MMKIRILLSIVFSSACSLIASGQNPFVGALPADAKLTKGMFDTFESDGKMYWSIPDSLFGREYSVTTTI